MNLLDIVQRTTPPVPWAEGEKIPWDDAAFSRRMLDEHLSQAHDLASRRAETIERHVAWIHGDLLAGRPTRILDLGCGPGLYTHRLATLGQECVGIDFAPASIAYAAEQAAAANLACTYRLADLREADYGAGFGLVMQIFGEFNVFRPAEAAALLDKAHAALDAGGLFLFEPQTFAAVERTGRAGRTFTTAESGLFSDRPHLWLEESFWDAAMKVATTRYYIVDAATATVTRHAASVQAYTDDEYRSLLADRGFEDVRFYPSLAGGPDEPESDLIGITARKPGGPAP